MQTKCTLQIWKHNKEKHELHSNCVGKILTTEKKEKQKTKNYSGHGKECNPWEFVVSLQLI